jgi:O-antigen ligase
MSKREQFQDAFRILETSRIYIKGFPPLDSESASQPFLKSTLLLLLSVGVLAPGAAIVSGITGPTSLLFFVAFLLLYTIIILSKRWLLAGMSAGVIVLAFFNIGAPLGPSIGFIRPELRPVDIFLIPLGVLVVLDRVDAQDGCDTVIFGILITLFALWALISGSLNYLIGNPASGVVFGIQQLRYPLIGFVGIFAARRFTFRYVLTAVMSVSALQICYSIIEAVLRRSIGLSYFGDIEVVNIQNKIFGPIVIGSGLYPGGFIGTSRALLAVVVLVFPLAVYWLLFRRQAQISAFIIALGTPTLVVISRSHAGMVIVPLTAIGTIASLSYINKLANISGLKRALAGTIVAIGVGIVMLVGVLQTGIFGNTTIRLQQYTYVLRHSIQNPIFGVGGQNFPLLITGNFGSRNLALEGLEGIHSTVLAYLLELGVIGTLFYIGAAGVAYTKSLQRYVRNQPDSKMYGAIAIGMLAFHAYSSLTLVYQRPPVMLVFWLVSGATVSSIESIR